MGYCTSDILKRGHPSSSSGPVDTRRGVGEAAVEETIIYAHFVRDQFERENSARRGKRICMV